MTRPSRGEGCTRWVGGRPDPGPGPIRRTGRIFRAHRSRVRPHLRCTGDREGYRSARDGGNRARRMAHGARSARLGDPGAGPATRTESIPVQASSVPQPATDARHERHQVRCPRASDRPGGCTRATPRCTFPDRPSSASDRPRPWARSRSRDGASPPRSSSNRRGGVRGNGFPHVWTHLWKLFVPVAQHRYVPPPSSFVRVTSRARSNHPPDGVKR